MSESGNFCVSATLGDTPAGYRNCHPERMPDLMKEMAYERVEEFFRRCAIFQETSHLEKGLSQEAIALLLSQQECGSRSGCFLSVRQRVSLSKCDGVVTKITKKAAAKRDSLSYVSIGRSCWSDYLSHVGIRQTSG